MNQGVFPQKCSGPAGSGVADAVLGTGGHTPFSGLAGVLTFLWSGGKCWDPKEEQIRFPAPGGASFLDKLAATRERRSVAVLVYTHIQSYSILHCVAGFKY